jgi:hypothetical protein
MTIRMGADGVILLEGDCLLEEAEELLRHLLVDPRPAVDWRACTAAHTAVLQVLLAARPALRGPPEGEFLRMFVDAVVQSDRLGSKDNGRQS